LDRIVAVKMISAAACAGPGGLARFHTEAQAAARLQHPNVVGVFEVGEHEGVPYLVLEYVEGGNLAQQTAGMPVPARQAARLIEALARAVHSAHRAGIIHRDIKPANVLLAPTPGQKPAILPSSDIDLTWRTADLEGFVPKPPDFGLAKQLDEAHGLTETGAIVGTPSYMAPEQAEGTAGEVGPATDVYALGALLYELLTGRPPLRGVTRLDTLQQVICDQPVAPSRLVPGLPADLETVCLKCLEKEPHKRYQSALALAEDLARFLAGEPVRARPVGRLERCWRACRRRPVLAGMSAALALAVLVGLALVLWQWRRAEENFTAAETARAEAEAHLKEAR